ncbi:phosphate transport system permease protein PstC [Abditibacteriota bacterium]|nr:phosphate transport system permease protein PstC [Abditibacteriota bacterium]
MIATPPEKRSLFKRQSTLDARTTDGIFYWSTLGFSALVLLLVAWLGIQLYSAASPSIHKFGLGFLTSSMWSTSDDPIHPDTYGAWPYIYGTLVSSFLALLLAVPIGLGTAIYLAELAPKWLRTPLSFMVELLAAVPSVVYGLWGRLVLIPALMPLQTWLSDHADSVPVVGRFFGGAATGQSMMAAALVLAIMILPFISAVSREVIKAVPPTQREAAFGLGATHWEAIKGPILRTARSGIIGAIILGLARALGETMAITMVIGNAPNADFSLLSPAATLSSKLAVEFAEASGGQQSALMYLALVLFGITIVVNACARLLIWNMSRQVKGSTRA